MVLNECSSSTKVENEDEEPAEFDDKSQCLGCETAGLIRYSLIEIWLNFRPCLGFKFVKKPKKSEKLKKTDISA